MGIKHHSIKRIRQISQIVIRYGLGEFIKHTKSRLFKQIDEYTAAFRFRKMLEELGPTFVKFGQLLSTQESILPITFVKELKKLQDEVEPFSFDDVKKIVETNFKKPIDEIFDEFNKIPEASASLGQVHKARLKSGEYVAVKIQRPNIEEIIDGDLLLLKQIGSLINDRVRDVFHFEIYPLIKEFEKTIKREINYDIEAHSIETFKNNLKNFENVYIPRVYWEYTNRHVLTMEYIFGYKATNKQLLIEKGFDLKKISEYGAKVFWYQIFDVGMFHADPHPGNIIIMEDGKICYIDFGMVGRIAEDDKLNLIEMISGFIEQDEDRMLQAIENFSKSKQEVNKSELKSDIAELISIYHSLPLNKMHLSDMLHDVLGVLRKHKINIVRSSSSLLRAIAIADGVGRDFYPEFNFVKVAKPYFKRFARKYYSPFRIYKALLKPNANYLFAAKKLPVVFRNIFTSLEDGKVQVSIDVFHLDKMINTIRYVARQIGISLVMSAVIIATGMLVSNGVGPKVCGISLYLIIGLLIVIILGIGIWHADKKL